MCTVKMLDELMKRIRARKASKHKPVALEEEASIAAKRAAAIAYLQSRGITHIKGIYYNANRSAD